MSRTVFFPSGTLIYSISRDGSKNFKLRTWEHMILGQLRIGARSTTYAALPLSNTHAEGAFPNNGTPALQKTSIDILERQMSEFPPFFYPLPNAVSVSVLGFMATEIELIIFSFFSDLQSSIFDYSLEISSNGYSWKL